MRGLTVWALLPCALLGATRLPADTLRILTPDGQPAAGAVVEIWPPYSGTDPLAAMAPPLFRVEAGEDGGVSWSPPARSGFLLLVNHPLLEPYHQELDPSLWKEGLRLRPGWAWRASVSGDGPLPAASRACASWTERLERWQLSRGFERCAPIAEGGTFELRGLAARPLEARIEVPGYLVAERAVAPNQAPSVVKLEAGHRVQGRVVAARTGQALAGAVVTSAGSAGVASDAQGLFELGVAQLPAVVEVSAPGFRAARLPSEPPLSGERVVVRLEPGQGVAFTLTDSEAQQLSAADLWVEHAPSSGSRRAWSSVITARPDGRFVVELPEPGTYSLSISTAELRGIRIPAVLVPEGQTVDLGNLALERGAGIAGQMIDAASNRPVAGVEVTALPLGLRLLRVVQSQRWPRAVSDSEGRFALSGLSPGRSVVAFEHPRFARRRIEVVLEPGELLSAGSVWLDRGVRLRGSVQGAPLLPVQGLSIRLFEADLPLLAPAAEVVTYEAGRFSMPALAPGRYRVEVRNERPLLSQEIELLPGAEVQSIELLPASSHVRCRVLDLGNPVAGGSVTLEPLLDPGREMGKLVVRFEGRREASFTHGSPSQPYGTPVAADGRFALTGVAPGAYALAYQSAAAGVTRRLLTIPEAGLDECQVRLQGRSWAGRVVDRETGAGVSGALEVRNPEGVLLAEQSADAEGGFAIEGLPAGQLELGVVASGYRNFVARADALSGAGGPALVELTPEQDGELALRVSDAAGEPVGGLLVTLLAEAGGVVRSLLTGPSGERRFSGLAAGSYFVVLTDPAAGLAVSQALRVEGGSSLSLSLDLTSGSFVALECDPDQCGQAAIERLALRTGGGPELSTFLQTVSPAMRLSDAGALGLGLLGPGTYQALLEVRGRRYSAEFTVTGPEPTLVRLR